MNDPPRVSILIPAYYSHGTIGDCLDALRCQTFEDFETIVVNSSPGDETKRIVTERYPEVRFIQHETRLLPHDARNLGMHCARGELIVFTDPDCAAAHDWIERLVAAHNAGHDAVSGAMACRGRTYLERAIHLCKFWWALPDGAAHQPWVVSTANALYARQLWERIGPFDSSLYSGDALLTWRAKQAGHPPWFEPAAVVAHTHEKSLLEFLRRRLNRGLEFGEQRAVFERWSPVKLLLLFLLTPVIPIAVTLRAAAPARTSGWSNHYLATLPVQWMGHLAWTLGEARAFAGLLRRQVTGGGSVS